MIKELQLLGMSRNEAIAYWALVKKGPCRAGVIIDALDVHRNIIYQSLDGLIHKGYATKVSVRGVWQYQITEPDVLLTNLKRHEEIARNIIEEIAAISQNASRFFKVHEGLESYRRYWLTSIERAPDGTIDYIAGGNIEPWAEIMGKKALNEYWKTCIQKNIRWKSLYFGITETAMKALRDTPVPCEARNWAGFVPQNFSGNFNVLYDSIILHTVEGLPRIIEIRDEAIVPMFQNYFDIMWNQAEVIEVK